MLRRCHDPKHKNYTDYGARGIIVCERWRFSFSIFMSDMGERPLDEKYSIERRDNNGPYAPENCYWKPLRLQNRNKRSTRKLTFNGETLSLLEWCEKTGLTYSALKTRIRDGWSVERALITTVTTRIASANRA